MIRGLDSWVARSCDRSLRLEPDHDAVRCVPYVRLLRIRAGDDRLARFCSRGADGAADVGGVRDPGARLDAARFRRVHLSHGRMDARRIANLRWREPEMADVCER